MEHIDVRTGKYIPAASNVNRRKKRYKSLQLPSKDDIRFCISPALKFPRSKLYSILDLQLCIEAIILISKVAKGLETEVRRIHQRTNRENSY